MYKCEMCKSEFEDDPDWTLEDREEEEIRLWGKLDKEDKMTVCDICFRLVMGNMIVKRVYKSD